MVGLWPLRRACQVEPRCPGWIPPVKNNNNNPPIRRSFPYSSVLTFHSLDTVDQFRPDGRCGPRFTKNGRWGQCRRNKETQCCNAQGFCSSSAPENCRCRTCTDWVIADIFDSATVVINEPAQNDPWNGCQGSNMRLYWSSLSERRLSHFALSTPSTRMCLYTKVSRILMSP